MLRKILRCVLPIAASAIVLPALAEAEDHGLQATYYDDVGFTGAEVARVDPEIDFDWGTGSPAAAIGGDSFSVRWVGQLEVPLTGRYTISTLSDDGIRVWIGGDLLINDWNDHPPTADSAAIDLEAGRRYDLVVAYYENGGGALARLSWRTPAGIEQVIPSSALHPQAAPVALALRTPTESRTSPAWIAGPAPAGAVTASVGGSPVPVERSGGAWHLAAVAGGVPLEAGAPVPVTVSAGDATIASSIAWVVTDLADGYGVDGLAIRVGDSLLVTDSSADAAEIDPDYQPAAGFHPVHRVTGGRPVAVRFDDPGTHLVRSRVDGAVRGSLEVHVVAVDWSGPTACQIGFERDKRIAATGAGSIRLGSSDPFALSVRTVPGSDGPTLRVCPLGPAEASIVATIGDEWGPEVARQRVDSFAVWTTATRSTFVERTNPDGSTLSRASLFIAPLVRGLDVGFRVFVSGVTFADSSTAFTVSTDAFATDLSSSGSRGVFAYGLIRLPGIPWGVCHAYVLRQGGVQVSR